MSDASSKSCTSNICPLHTLQHIHCLSKKSLFCLESALKNVFVWMLTMSYRACRDTRMHACRVLQSRHGRSNQPSDDSCAARQQSHAVRIHYKLCCLLATGSTLVLVPGISPWLGAYRSMDWHYNPRICSGTFQLCGCNLHPLLTRPKTAETRSSIIGKTPCSKTM